jgi:hypothetical protein
MMESTGVRTRSQIDEQPILDEAEVPTLAMDLARAYQRMVQFYHHQLEMALPDADQRARGLDYSPEEAAADLARIRDRPPDQVSWFDLNRLVERDPAAMDVVWEDIKEAAYRELVSGQRTAKALTWDSRPWERARFLAIRESLRGEPPPQPGIETALVDLAAEAYADYLEWTEHLHMQAGTEVQSEKQILEHDGAWRPMRLSYAEAIEHSSTMAERAHRRFLRTVAALGQLRQTAPVYVAQAGQVNIGQQQVVITRVTAGDDV